MRQKLTHGEKFYYLKTNINLKEDTITICRRYDSLPKPMSKTQAVEYYGAKLRKYFGTEVKPRDFRSVQEYYDYYEAQRLLRSIRTQKRYNIQH